LGKDYAGIRLTSEITTSAADDQAAEIFLATLLDGLVFLFHPGTTWKTKLWDEKGWIELGKALTESFPDATILLSFGGEMERLSAERIATGIGRHTKLLPQLSIKGFAALIKKVDIMFGGDTGPIHIAAAVGTPTISFYRSTDGRRNGPRGDMHRIIQSPLPCAKCLNRECDKDAACRESIKVNDMFSAAVELLKNPQNDNDR